TARSTTAHSPARRAASRSSSAAILASTSSIPAPYRRQPLRRVVPRHVRYPLVTPGCQPGRDTAEHTVQAKVETLVPGGRVVRVDARFHQPRAPWVSLSALLGPDISGDSLRGLAVSCGGV